MNDASLNRNSQLIRIAVTAWLVLLTTVLIALAISGTNLRNQLQRDAPDAAIESLQTHMTNLETFKAQIENAPAMLSLLEFRQARQALERQIEALDQRQQVTRNSSELDALRNRIDALEQQLSDLKRSSPPPPIQQPQRTTASRSTNSLAPPFTPMGIESRGGERFLALLPNGETALPQVRLLRIGEAEGRWRLQALEAGSAVFSVNQKTRRLDLPQE
ncbi:hypothetical protein [Pseudomonas sp. MWU12-2037]|uniref:hypothetical protein n=1 Tax=Pseudomonas sp. MWU12-2037 TaxID=2928690 RepID=UPI00200CF776|nr:hypothetical protein [Pseudomonas sp. MWU12-2037]